MTTTANTQTKSDIYTDITRQIIEAIENGTATHNLPWQGVSGLPLNVASKRSYRGINTLLLWLIGNRKGYTTSYWATFKQWLELGHPVRKGEQSATVVFWKQLAGSSGEDQAEPDAAENRGPIVARAYHVFNAAQVEGYIAPEITPLSETERDARAEAFFAGLPIKIEHGGTEAYYAPAADSVHLPEYRVFKDAEAYYSTLGHECVHATGAKHRLDRDLSGRFGSEAYAMEELVAELGAAYLCGDLGLSKQPRLDHAGYIESWLKVLKGDPRAIFTAAGKAQAAVDWLHLQE